MDSPGEIYRSARRAYKSSRRYIYITIVFYFLSDDQLYENCSVHHIWYNNIIPSLQRVRCYFLRKTRWLVFNIIFVAAAAQYIRQLHSPHLHCITSAAVKYRTNVLLQCIKIMQRPIYGTRTVIVSNVWFYITVKCFNNQNFKLLTLKLHAT